MDVFETLTDAIKGLIARGYTVDFSSRVGNGGTGASHLAPSRFRVTEVYRFDGGTDPDAEEVLYAIEGINGERGFLVNGYGVSADDNANAVVAELEVDHHLKSTRLSHKVKS